MAHLLIESERLLKKKQKQQQRQQKMLGKQFSIKITNFFQNGAQKRCSNWYPVQTGPLNEPGHPRHPGTFSFKTQHFFKMGSKLNAGHFLCYLQ